MKKYWAALLIAIIVAASSLIFRFHFLPLLKSFPIHKSDIVACQPTLYLFVFFSIRNCAPCLDMLESLNDLPHEYKVIGVVPEEELEIEIDLRKATKARFEIRSQNGYKRFWPNYYPTIIGTNSKGDVLFVLPGVPGEHTYLTAFLEAFYYKAYQLLKE